MKWTGLNEIREKYLTFFETDFAIDEIMLSSGWRLIDSGMKDAEGHSDHNMLWAVAEYIK